VPKKCADGPPKYGFAADFAILLRAPLLLPGADAAAAGNDERGITALILVLFLHSVFTAASAEVEAGWS
jgi:hypothetical protein